MIQARWIRVGAMAAVLAIAACSSSKSNPSEGAGAAGSAGDQGQAGTGGDQGQAGSGGSVTPGDDLGSIMVGRINDAVAAADPKYSGTDFLTPDDYVSLEQTLSQVDGVESAVYTGDQLGTIAVKVTNGGFIIWRHHASDWDEAVPDGLDPLQDIDAQLQPGWNPPDVMQWPYDDDPADNYATHFPVATDKPDPDYTADDAVACPAEGKIAIVDFYYSLGMKLKPLPKDESPHFYADDYVINGVLLWDRVTRIAQAAGFTVKLFQDDEITAGNFDQLKDYNLVITHGHGFMPSVRFFDKYGFAATGLFTPEKWSDPTHKTLPDKVTTYQQAWEKGNIYLTRDGSMVLVSTLFRDYYKPAIDQQWILNECWTMQPKGVGQEDVKATGLWTFEMLDQPVDHFGSALMKAGVKVAFGYKTPSNQLTIRHHMMRFLRRQFGGYFAKDTPPAAFGLSYWPTCMASQTYFRPAAKPNMAVYGDKIEGTMIFTMYSAGGELYLRKVCQGNPSIPHSDLQQFMLKVGTPATAPNDCFAKYYGSNNCPSCITDQLCCQGDCPSTQDNATHASCAVKIARKVTNDVLKK